MWYVYTVIHYAEALYFQLYRDSGSLYFLAETVAEPFGSDQTLIWALNFGLSLDPRLAQPNCY